MKCEKLVELSTRFGDDYHDGTDDHIDRQSWPKQLW